MKKLKEYKAKPSSSLDKQGYFYKKESSSSSWSNKIIYGDNKDIIMTINNGFLMDEINRQGGVKLIYIDPPFEIGADHNMKIDIGGEHQNNSFKIFAYQDNRGKENFIHFMRERLILMRQLLSVDGSIYLHCDWRTSGWFRVLLDEIFGESFFINENIWSYKTGGVSKRSFAKKHDTIFLYSKTKNYIFNTQYYKSWQKKRYNYNKKYPEFYDEETSRWYHLSVCRDVWDDIYPIGTENKERVGYPTQKPEALLERIIKASSNEGDIVADFFSGSATTAAVAERLKRKWIVTDIGIPSIQISKKRMIKVLEEKSQISNHINPFEIINLKDIEGYKNPLPNFQFDFKIKFNIKDNMISIELINVIPEDDKVANENINEFIKKNEKNILSINGRAVKFEKDKKYKYTKKEYLTEHWSDWVDSWAVDLDYNTNLNFFSGHWYSFRTKYKRDIKLKTDYFDHSICKSKMAVMVTDIFGNEFFKEFSFTTK